MELCIRWQERDEAKKILDKLLKLSNKEYVSPFFIALIYTGLNQKDQAFEWLEKSYEKREGKICWLKADHTFDSLRSDPRFKALLKKMNLE